MKLHHGILSVMLTGLLIMGLSACEKEAPVEQAGKAIDQTAADAAEQAGESKEAVGEKMNK